VRVRADDPSVIDDHISSQRPCAELGELVRLLLWKLDER
jgi:hypothetical protein